MITPGSAADPPVVKNEIVGDGLIPIFIDGQMFMKSKKEALQIASTIIAIVSGFESD